MTRLLWWLVVLAVVYAGFWLHASESGEWETAVILLFIGVTLTLGGIMMLAVTREWTTRGIGILFVVLGDGVLYAFIGSRRWFDPGSGVSEGITDLARSAFVVGGTLLLYGAARYLVEWRRGHMPHDGGPSP